MLRLFSSSLCHSSFIFQHSLP